MNISLHTFFPNKWKDGQIRYNGAVEGPGYFTTALTRWFPVITTGLCPFFIPSNASTLFGGFYGYIKGSFSYITVFNNVPLTNNVCITDGNATPKSKQFSVILY